MSINDEIDERGKQGSRKVIEQEARVQCVWCGADTECTGLAVRDHVVKCEKHPLSKALNCLRFYADQENGERARNVLFSITGEGSIDMGFLL